MKNGLQVIGLACGIGFVASGQAVAANGVYTCLDANDKPVKIAGAEIADCKGKQTVREPNGRVTVLTKLTPVEARGIAEAERKADADEAARQEAIRADNQLLEKFADEAAHRKARAARLEPVSQRMRGTEERLAALAVQRKPLIEEAKFYVGKKLPADLQRKFDVNDASIAAQKDLLQSQQLQAADINARYDTELARLKKLWSGTPPGSMGLIK